MSQRMLWLSCITGLLLTGLMTGAGRTRTAGAAPGGVTTVPLHRFYELGKDTFNFYTTDAKEVAALKKHHMWKYVGVIGHVLPTYMDGMVPLYRLVKAEFGQTNHFYTVDENEAKNAMKHGWTHEGQVGFISPTESAGTVALHRLYKPCVDEQGETLLDKLTGAGPEFIVVCQKAVGGDNHFYTTDSQEALSATNLGYQYIRTEGYVWKNETTLPPSNSFPPKGPTPAFPKDFDIKMSYEMGFGRAPTQAELDYWRKQMAPSFQSYTGILKKHSEWLKTPAAAGERAAMVGRNYQLVFGRPPTTGEADFWTKKIAAEGTTFDKISTANIKWLKGDAPAQVKELRDTIRRAYLAAGKPEPTESQYQAWMNTVKFATYVFKSMVAKIKTQ